MIAAVRRGGFGTSFQAIALQVLSLMAGAFLLTWLVLQTAGLGYVRRVPFLTVAGLPASVLVDLPNWNRVGILRRIHGSESRRYHAHLAPRGIGDRKAGEDVAPRRFMPVAGCHTSGLANRTAYSGRARRAGAASGGCRKIS